MTDDFVVPPTPVVGVPVVGSTSLFPVRRIYCVGRNYAEHIKEMGGDERQPPFFFQKPTDAIVQNRAKLRYPVFTQDFQHEIELVLAVGTGGREIEVADSPRHVFGLAVGIDFTRRDVQIAARKAGRPWEIGKSFDQSAPITAISPLGAEGLPERGSISLAVNGEIKQSGDLAEMIWGAAEIVSQLSKQYRLEPGDLIYTGTPAGVGGVVPGDRLEGRIDGLEPLFIEIAVDTDHLN